MVRSNQLENLTAVMRCMEEGQSLASVQQRLRQIAGGRVADLGQAVDAWRDQAAADWLRQARDDQAQPRVATGWPELDAALDGGLMRGGLHEWFAQPGDFGDPPAMGIITHLARQGWQSQETSWAAWIGRRAWPHPANWDAARQRTAVAYDLASPSGHRASHALPWVDQQRGPFVPADSQCSGDDAKAQAAGSVFRRQWLLVDPPDEAGRVWAADVALRNPAVSVVVIDGQGMKIAATRRLQLAAQAGGAVALVVRHWRERGSRSAATTRWYVQAVPTDGSCPRWQLTLHRCKGMQRGPGMDAATTWQLEWNHAQGAVVMAPPLAHGCAASPAEEDSQADIRPARSA